MYLLGIPLTLLISVVLARGLGPQAFGQYAFVMALLTLLTLPVVAGVAQLLTREVATYSQSGEWSLFRGVGRAANMWVLLVSLAILLVYFAVDKLAGWLPTGGKWALLGIAVFLIPFRGLNAVRNGATKGLGYPSLAEMPTQIVQPVILLAVLIVLLSANVLTIESVLLSQVVVAAVTFTIASVIFLRIRPRGAVTYQPSYKPGVWLNALLPLTMIGLIGTLSTQIGIVVLGLFGYDDGVAGLRVAERGAQFVALSLTLVNMVIAPHIVRAFRDGDMNRLQRLSRQSARGAFLLALPIGLGLILFGKSIISLVYGSEYSVIAFEPMVILVVGQLFNVGMGSVGVLLAMSGYEKMSLWGQLAGLCTTVLLAIALIPSFQELGAAAASTAGLIVWNCVMGIAVARHLKIRAGIL